MTHVITGAVRRGARALRSVGPATVAVAVALIIGAAGFADAATGGDFLLGKTNVESSTAVLRDTTGVPLSLKAPSGEPPLSVNSTTQVKRLNAQYVGGESAAELGSSGGVGVASSTEPTELTEGALTTVASTGALPAGTYYVSATALLYSGGLYPVYCRISPAPAEWGGGIGTSYIQGAETSVATVPAGSIVSEVCLADGTDQFAADAGIIAIRIDSSSTGTMPAVVRGNAVAGPPKS